MTNDKILKIAEAFEKANKEHKSLRWLGYFHDAALYVVCLLVLITGAIYAYERYRPIEEYINPIAMVATKLEFEAQEQIGWIPITTVDSTLSDITINTTLRCDDGDGDGYEFTSSSTQPYEQLKELTPAAVAEITLAISDNEVQAFHSVTQWIREFAKDHDVKHMIYEGAIPVDISTCYGDHTFIAETPILGLLKKVTVNSYPFDYVWYNTYRRIDKND